MFTRKDHFVVTILFLALFFIFVFSPVVNLRDSRYSLLLSHSLITHRSFDLSGYTLPVATKQTKGRKTKLPYQIQVIHNKPYYFFPYGGAILAVPYVYLSSKIFQIAPASPDGSYNPSGERVLQIYLAAFLMAAVSVLFFYTARFILPISLSIIISLAGTLGTQLWSTTSRALESHTWMIFLLAMIVFLLMRERFVHKGLNLIVLATLASWMYFVRPTSAIDILLLSAFVFFKERSRSVPFFVTGFIWLVLFVIFSYSVFDSPFPIYYNASRLLSYPIPEFLLGHLFSPSRGLFIFLPWFVFSLYLFCRYFTYVENKDLIALAFLSLIGHLLVVSAFPQWWGGHSYGPRLLSDVVPWIVLIAILSVSAWHKQWKNKNFTLRVEQAVGALLLSLSIFIHGYGAISNQAWKWNALPKNIDDDPSRVWDWRSPQFFPRNYN